MSLGTGTALTARALCTLKVAPLRVLQAPGKGCIPRMKSTTSVLDSPPVDPAVLAKQLGGGALAAFASRRAVRNARRCGPQRGPSRCLRASRHRLPSTAHRRHPRCRSGPMGQPRCSKTEPVSISRVIKNEVTPVWRSTGHDGMVNGRCTPKVWEASCHAR